MQCVIYVLLATYHSELTGLEFNTKLEDSLILVHRVSNTFSLFDWANSEFGNELTDLVHLNLVFVK